MTSTTNRSKFRLSPSSLLIGILIPIIATLIPYAIKIIYPEHQLVYEITGPITANQISAMGLVISNKGRKTEKNVKIWIEADFIGRKVNPQDLIIESKSKYSIFKDRDYYVISIGDLRPAEKISLSAIIPGSLYFIIT